MDVAEKVRSIVVEHLGVAPAEVIPEAKFEGNSEGALDADSLDMVELTMAFEEEFAIEIADDEASKIITVADAIALIEGKRNDE